MKEKKKLAKKAKSNLSQTTKLKSALLNKTGEEPISSNLEGTVNTKTVTFSDTIQPSLAKGNSQSKIQDGVDDSLNNFSINNNNSKLNNSINNK